MDGAARGAVANSNVTGRVHGRAAHPAVGGVRGEGALLEQAECAGGGNGSAQLIPAHAHRGSGGNGMVHDQGFVVAEVAERQAVHQAVAQ